MEDSGPALERRAKPHQFRAEWIVGFIEGIEGRLQNNFSPVDGKEEPLLLPVRFQKGVEGIPEDDCGLNAVDLEKFRFVLGDSNVEQILQDFHLNADFFPHQLYEIVDFVFGEAVDQASLLGKPVLESPRAPQLPHEVVDGVPQIPERVGRVLPSKLLEKVAVALEVVGEVVVEYPFFEGDEGFFLVEGREDVVDVALGELLHIEEIEGPDQGLDALEEDEVALNQPDLFIDAGTAAQGHGQVADLQVVINHDAAGGQVDIFGADHAPQSLYLPELRNDLRRQHHRGRVDAQQRPRTHQMYTSIIKLG